MRIDRRAVARTLSTIGVRIYRAAPEILFAVAALAGWAALTVGVRVVTHGAPAVWPLAIGVLLMSACGWGLLGKLAYRGVYVVWRQSKKANQGRG